MADVRPRPARRLEPLEYLGILAGVAILACLAIRMVSGFSEGSGRAQVSATAAQLRQIGIALELYRGEMRRLPAAHDAPVTERLLSSGNEWYLRPVPRAVDSDEPFRLTVFERANGVLSYVVIAPGTFPREAFVGIADARGEQCASSCTRLKLVDMDVVGF